jgi:FdhE protein
MTAASELEGLERRNPEWAPWLAVVRKVLEAIQDRAWDGAVPERPGPRHREAPLLAKTALQLDAGAVGRFLEELRRSAGRAGTAKMAGLHAVPYSQAGALATFQAALNGDDDRLRKLASDAGADPEAFRAVAALAPMPFLHACSRRWASAIPQDWSQGYCPICGGWPALVDVCGVERSRYLRCARCGSAWQAPCLSCPYCGTSDHKKLAALVPEQKGSKSAIDACNECLGYVKVFATLQVGPPEKVMLVDLASVELDLAAAARGYARPAGAGYALEAT